MTTKGRPTSYTQEIAEEICEKLAAGMTLLDICDDDKMPNRSTLYNWRMKNEAFHALYTRAREIQLEVFEDDIIKTALECGDNVNHGRLIVDAKKWIMSKRNKNMYGDATKHEHTGKDGDVLKIVIEDVAAGDAKEGEDGSAS